MTNEEKVKKLHEIADALEQWGEYNEKVTNAAKWGTPEAKQIIRKAITLLRDNLALLNECKNKYGLNGLLQQCFANIEQAASWPKTKKMGDCKGWCQEFTKRPLWEGERRSFADECVRYANEVDRETEQGNKETKREQEGIIEPKPLEILSISAGKHFPRTKQPITPKKCFVLMPIQKGFEEVYHDVIKPTLKEMGLQAIRADEIYSSNQIMDDIWENIQTAGWIIADMSGRNPNVFYETGMAHAIGRDVIMLVQNIEDVPFDLRHWRVILYNQTIRGGVELKEKLKKTILHDKQYAQIPIDLLTKEFKGGFIVDHTETTVKFSGVNGSCAMFSEKWNIITTRKDPYQSFHRKIGTSGSIEEVEGIDCSVSCRQFLTGNFIFTITSPTTLSKGKDFPYSLNYKILNGFSPGEEVWTFGIESETKLLYYSLIFCEECMPSSFKALLRTESGESIKTLDVKETTQKKTKTYTIKLDNLSIGVNIVFRWQWNYQKQL